MAASSKYIFEVLSWRPVLPYGRGSFPGGRHTPPAVVARTAPAYGRSCARSASGRAGWERSSTTPGETSGPASSAADPASSRFLLPRPWLVRGHQTIRGVLYAEHRISVRSEDAEHVRRERMRSGEPSVILPIARDEGGGWTGAGRVRPVRGRRPLRRRPGVGARSAAGPAGRGNSAEALGGGHRGALWSPWVRTRTPTPTSGWPWTWPAGARESWR